jgi:predicted AlkP superfamily phosphohydrolase/phosphomutase
MRYLRMLSNSMAAAVLMTTYVIALFLHLNPQVPLQPARLLPLASTIGFFYVLHLTAVFYVLLVLRQLFAHEVFSPAWISVDVLTRLGALAAAAGAVLMWRNLTAFALALGEPTAVALDRAALLLAAAATLFALLALLRLRAPGTPALWAPPFVLVAAASVAAPIASRAGGTRPPLEARPIDTAFAAARTESSTRVTLIAIDAASLDLVTRAAAEGRLPNFGRILDAGAVRHLATIRPTSPEAVWAAVATGKLSHKNGVRSSGTYHVAGSENDLQLLPEYCFAHGLERFGFLSARPHSSATVRVRTLWSIASTSGYSVGVVGWPLTQPASPVRGYLVSDMFQRAALTASGIEEPSSIYPVELHPAALAAMESAADAAEAVVNASMGGASADPDPRQENAARVDRINEAIAQSMARARPAQLTLTRFESLDPVGHYFLRYAVPSEFGDVTEDERRRLGGVLERHYALIDDAIGRAIAALGPEDLLLVVSGYGMEPLGFARRLVERAIGDPDVNGTHDAAPDGFLMAYGGLVARGRQQPRASVVDVVPTILYFLGLPIGRDMDGYARTDLFQPSFTAERPITFIPTYDR